MIHSIKKYIHKRPLLSLLFLLILTLPITLHFVFWGLVSLKAPRYQGEIRSDKLTSKATVIRDEVGIPHIVGEDAKSAYFALGFTMAQDRIFQMELQRRIGKGELTEIFGEKLIPSDQFLKSLLLKQTAEIYANQTKHIYPEAWEQLDWFLEGVNHFLETEPLPIEYTILGIKPRPFDRVDAISFLFYMGFSFAEGIKSDSLYSIMESELVDRSASELFPRYDFEPNASILESQPGFKKLTSNLPIPNVNPKNDLKGSEIKSSLSRSNKDITNLKQLVTFVSSLNLPIEPLEGSNSWLVGPSRSASGGAVLANDPHIALSNPGAWYEAYIEYPGYENYGYFLSIIPFPLIAHNRDKAWGLTMLEQDDVNLYMETIEAGKYKSGSNWKDLTYYKDEIKQKDGTKIPFEVAITNHGPIITEHIKGYKGRPVSLYWAHHHLDNPLLDVLYKMGKSKSFQELDSASSMIGAPGLNFSYADKNGNIAYYAVGRFPILKSGNPRKILEGSTGENDVIGYVPSKDNPKIINPKNGIIVTANNLVTSGRLPGLGKPEGNWQPPDRFQRLVGILETQEKWSLEELAAIQNDTVSSFAPEYLEILFSSVKEPKTLGGKKVLEILKNWNFEHFPESQGAAVYDVFFYITMKELLIDEMGPEHFELYGDMAEYWNAYRRFIRNPNSNYWDDLRTVGTLETRTDILNRSIELTARYLEKNVSASPSLWKWKNLYKIKHPHPLGVLPLIGGVFNIGPLPSAGGAEVVNNLKYKLMKEDWTAMAGPSKRRVIDYGRFEESETQLPIGNSGNLGSPFYGNLVDDYINGVHRKILYSKSQVGDGKYRLEFQPK
ncbi:penicillin acylase family protein [Leptospira levettii]|uniref:penicillin acylase family protein n=1 Tax=Leptospira levettii TaxID=2023178 RepID=UPI001EE9C882|nr:penicillin acylase family protein [Leptospira levettii]MCG6148096.1 penicillin acylase family protein [Leptospira levettii]MCW7495309.1 penicillin acylase family protein [Leptospira levettii]